MAIKYVTLVALISLALVSAMPHSFHGHDDGGHGYGAGEGTSHQSVHLVSHDDSHGHDDGHGHGHGGYGHDGGHDDGSNTHAEYDFKYGVSDKKTGDHKAHSETRDGHKVSGHYELIDSDGHKRTVIYTADKHKGFQATVHREATHIHVPAPKGGLHAGGHAALQQHSVEHGHGGHDAYGHGGHGHGSSSHGFSLSQDHGHSFGGHGQAHGYGHEYGHH